MFILVNRDIELSCDEAVVRSFGIPAMNVNMNVNAKKSAVSATIPVGFNKTLTYNSSEGADSIKLQSEVTDIKFTLDATKSAVSTPENWHCYNNEQPYLYQEEDAIGNINANIDECAFAINYKKTIRKTANYHRPLAHSQQPIQTMAQTQRH